MSRIDVLLNRLPLYTIVSRNVTFSSEISAVNLIVAWRLFACSMKCVICSLPVPQREKMSSIYLFQQIGFITLFLNNSVSTFAMKKYIEKRNQSRKRRYSETLSEERIIEQSEEALKAMNRHSQRGTCPKTLQYKARARIRADEAFKTFLKIGQ